MTPDQIDAAAKEIIDANADVIAAFVAVKHKNGHIELRWTHDMLAGDISLLTDIAKAASIKRFV